VDRAKLSSMRATLPGDFVIQHASGHRDMTPHTGEVIEKFCDLCRWVHQSWQNPEGARAERKRGVDPSLPTLCRANGAMRHRALVFEPNVEQLPIIRRPTLEMVSEPGDQLPRKLQCTLSHLPVDRDHEFTIGDSLRQLHPVLEGSFASGEVRHTLPLRPHATAQRGL